MSKSVLKVFLIIGALVLALVAWSLTFGDGGLVQAGWNGMATYVNGIYSKITGSTDNKLVPEMRTARGKADVEHNSKLDPASKGKADGFSD